MPRKLEYTEEEGKKMFFTSDSHWRHENIIKYCGRPFSSVDEMDEELIRRWNEKVPKDGVVWHLGDVGFAHPQIINDILDRLNGTINLVIGNHDWRRVLSQHSSRFNIIAQQVSMKIGKQHIVLNHYPFLCFSGAYRGLDSTWQLFGHVHTSKTCNMGLDQKRMVHLFPTQYDVGVDNNDYAPISFEEVKKIITERQLSLNMVSNNETHSPTLTNAIKLIERLGISQESVDKVKGILEGEMSTIRDNF